MTYQQEVSAVVDRLVRESLDDLRAGARRLERASRVHRVIDARVAAQEALERARRDPARG